MLQSGRFVMLIVAAATIPDVFMIVYAGAPEARETPVCRPLQPVQRHDCQTVPGLAADGAAGDGPQRAFGMRFWPTFAPSGAGLISCGFSSGKWKTIQV